MIPARDRQLRLTIYNTQANMEAETNGTVIESGIYDSSARLEHTFFTALPGWGEANASMFTCELADAPDLAGKYIRARVLGYATEAATSRTTYRVFAGKIDSCRYDKYKASRTLEAYDRLYELRKVDISEWWNTWVQTLTADTVTLPSVLAAMCTQYGVTNSASVPAYSTGTAPLKARKLGACSFVQMLSYIGEICGGYFSMQDGPLRFVDMRNVNGATAQESVDGNLDTQLTEIADGDTGIYTQVTIYEGSDIVYSQGSGKNLAITDNPFLVGQTPATINSWGANIYTNATRMFGWPATLALVYSQPQSAWSRITATSPFILTTTDEGTTRRHIVSGYSFSGPGLIDETISCTGEMREGASYSAAQNAMLSELTDLGTQLTFKVNADAVIEAVNLEAQGGVTINAEAIDINGAVSANTYFKINTDGSMETIKGIIGGWEISSDKLSKTVTVTDPSTQQVLGTYLIELSPSETMIKAKKTDALYGGGEIDITANGRIEASSPIERGSYPASYSQYFASYNHNLVYMADRVKQISGGDGNWHDRVLSYMQYSGFSVYSNYSQPYSGSPNKNAEMNRNGFHSYSSGTERACFSTSGAEFYDTNGNTVSKLNETELIVKGIDMLKYIYGLTAANAAYIGASQDLNTSTYCNPRMYYCSANATVRSLSNCPTQVAFVMVVRNLVDPRQDPNAGTYQYIYREITDINGDRFYQSINSSATAGTYNYGSWIRQWRTIDSTGEVLLTTPTATNSQSYAYFDVDSTHKAAVGWSSTLGGSFISSEAAGRYLGITDAGDPFFATSYSASARQVLARHGQNISIFNNNAGYVTNDINKSVSIHPDLDSWREGIRIYPHNNGWTTFLMGGQDLSAASGTSANTWSMHNHNGKFYITRNGSDSSNSAIMSCENNIWKLNGKEVVTGSLTTATRNTTNTTSASECTVYTRNVIAITHSLKFVMTSSGAVNGATLFTGLPKPAALVRFVMSSPNLTGAVGKAIQCVVDTSGNLKNDSGQAVSEATYYGQVTYALA